MIIVKEYTDDQQEKLKEFCETAKEHGLKNNSSFEAMKIQSIKYWVGYHENKIIAVSGIEECSGLECRTFVRAATLPPYHNVLGFGRDFASGSVIVRYVARKGIEYAHENGYALLFVSTNLNNNTSPWMTRNDKHAKRLCDLGVCTYIQTKELNHVMQNIYRLNYDRYIEYVDFLEKKYGN